MRNWIFGLAAVSIAAFASPAFAVMQPAGSVDVWPLPTHATTMYSNFTGDLVAFTARGNADVACRSVWATFADGSSALIFHGTLAPDDQIKVYLPGGTRNIQRMDFDCLSVDRGHAIVNVDANLAPGGYLYPLG